MWYFFFLLLIVFKVIPKLYVIYESTSIASSNSPGRFHPERVHVMYDCNGKQQSEALRFTPLVERTLSLNEFAIGEAIAKAKEVDEHDLWFFTIVLVDGTQHVYVGTPAQALNGMGNGRIRGCKALNIWLQDVVRIPPQVATSRETSPDAAPAVVTAPSPTATPCATLCVTPRPPRDPSIEDFSLDVRTPPSDATFDGFANHLFNWTYTQAEEGSTTRTTLLNAVAQVHHLFDSMGVVVRWTLRRGPTSRRRRRHKK